MIIQINIEYSLIFIYEYDINTTKMRPYFLMLSAISYLRCTVYTRTLDFFRPPSPRTS